MSTLQISTARCKKLATHFVNMFHNCLGLKKHIMTLQVKTTKHFTYFYLRKSHYIFSIRNNCWKFLTFDGSNLQKLFNQFLFLEISKIILKQSIFVTIEKLHNFQNFYNSMWFFYTQIFVLYCLIYSVKQNNLINQLLMQFKIT